MGRSVCRPWGQFAGSPGVYYVTCPAHPSYVVVTFDGRRSQVSQCPYCRKDD
jgi:hypothetical protein